MPISAEKYIIREQGLRGDWDYRLKAVYTIGILNYVFNESKDDKDYFHSEMKLMDIQRYSVSEMGNQKTERVYSQRIYNG
jgi:hypothetical protein